MQPERSSVSEPAQRLQPAPARREIAARTSIERGRGPKPGVHVPPYFWRNVLESPPPRRQRHGEGAYVLYHGTETEADARITYSTIVSVDPPKNWASRPRPVGDAPATPDTTDVVVKVDTRIGVQRRLLFEAIDHERAFMSRTSSRMRESLIRNLVQQRRAAQRLPARWMRRGAMGLVRVQGRAGLWGIRAMQRTADGLMLVPDKLFTQLLLVWGHATARVGRQGLWAGMRDPRSLTNEQKAVVLFLSSTLLLGTLILLNSSVPILFPSLAAAYSVLVGTFIFGVATAVALPFPPSEGLAIAAYVAAGPVLAFLTIVASKLVGAWLVFFIGDALNGAIAKQTEDKPRLARAVEWSKKNSERYGFAVLTVFLALPFLPDTLALYVFAVSGTRFRAFLYATAVGSGLRYAGVLTLYALYGDAVRGWLGL